MLEESKKLFLSLHRREVPRERWKKVIADGQRPYEGPGLGKLELLRAYLDRSQAVVVTRATTTGISD